jgi:hypothetical protein
VRSFRSEGLIYVRTYISDAKAREKPCVRCTHPLRQHLDDRYCPKCGLSVWISLNGNDSLDSSKPEWLRASAQGAWILALAQVLALAAYLLASYGYLAANVEAMLNPEEAMRQRYRQMAPHPATTTAAQAPINVASTTQPFEEDGEVFNLPPLPPSIPLAIAGVAIGAYFIVNAAGLYRLASHEQRYPDRMRTPRQAARVAAAISALFGVAMIAMALPRLKNGWPPEAWWSWPVKIGCEVVFTGCALLTWLWLRRIARRAGRSGLAKLCGYLLFLPALTLLKAAPFIGLWFLYLLSPLVSLLPLVYIPLSIYLFIRFALLMQAAAPIAEAEWKSESREPAAISAN